MDKLKITAEWARKESTNIFTEKIQKQIKIIEDSIVSATKGNKFSTNIFSIIDDVTIKEFESRGFKVSKYHGGSDPRDYSYITLSW